jgi:hypothetical protein
MFGKNFMNYGYYMTELLVYFALTRFLAIEFVFFIEVDIYISKWLEICTVDYCDDMLATIIL